MATTMKKIWPNRATLYKTVTHIAQLGDTPQEWHQQPWQKIAKELNNTRKTLKLPEKNYTEQQAHDELTKITPIIQTFDGTDKQKTQIVLQSIDDKIPGITVNHLKQEMIT